MGFPTHRPRRLRQSEALRRLVRETALTVDHLVQPYFVCAGEGVRRAIGAMPGQFHLSVDELVREAAGAAALGVPAVLLFGLPERRDAAGSEASREDGPVPRAIRALKRELPGLAVWADVCLCAYTDHGHCGLLRAKSGAAEQAEIDNDATLARLSEVAVAYARAGADVIAPSDMMDGRVGAIRRALDAAGFEMTPICSYAAKFASSFYGPFREAVDSAPRFGDRRGYQMDPGNALEALREVALDLEEGADLVIVKPAGYYLDVIWRVKERFGAPVAAYQVSGEYAALRAAAERGWIQGDPAMVESLLCLRRAGADMIITYFARDFARLAASR